MDPVISEICAQHRITDYLTNRGIELIRSGKYHKCCCPLGTHSDSDPSFCISTMSDGTEVFKCFGCGESGNIITIIHWLEKEKKGLVVKRLAKASGIKLGRMLEGVKLEPTPMEAMEFFCSEDELYDQIAEISLEFLQVHQTEDAVNKVSRLHEALDKIAETGDGAQLQAIRERLIKTISQYSE